MRKHNILQASKIIKYWKYTLMYVIVPAVTHWYLSSFACLIYDILNNKVGDELKKLLGNLFLKIIKQFE